jgi:hypothetical protein
MLGYLLVLVIAGAVGFGVYTIAMQVGAPPRPTRDVDEWKGTRASRSEPEEPQEIQTETGYAPVAPPDLPSWHSRLNGTVGLVLAVSLAAVTLAIAIYQVGHFIARLMSQAAKPG